MDQALWISLSALALSTLAGFLAFAAWFIGKVEDLHARIDRVKDGYFRRDDLSTHLHPIREAIIALRAEMRSISDLLSRPD